MGRIKIKDNQRGFSAVEIILILVVVALIGVAGFIVYKNQTKISPDSAKSSTTNVEEKTPPIASTSDVPQTDIDMTLASSSVAFKTPKTYNNDGIGCVKDSAAYDNQEYLDSTAILPGEKLITVYGSETEFFHINVCVFNNKNNLSAKDWFEGSYVDGGIGEGTGSSQDESVSTDINGNPGFYRKTKTSYEEVNYVVAAKGKLILVKARTYETDDKVPGAGDFRKFEPAIKELANSITVK